MAENYGLSAVCIKKLEDIRAAEVGIDKFRIPRWVIVNYTTMDDFISYVSGAA